MVLRRRMKKTFFPSCLLESNLTNLPNVKEGRRKKIKHKINLVQLFQLLRCTTVKEARGFFPPSSSLLNKSYPTSAAVWSCGAIWVTHKKGGHFPTPVQVGQTKIRHFSHETSNQKGLKNVIMRMFPKDIDDWRLCTTLGYATHDFEQFVNEKS